MKIFLIVIYFFATGCNTKDHLIESLKPEFETISFDVVQKKLVIEQDLPDHLQKILSQWFEKRVKIDGFDGNMIFIVSDFNQIISAIDDGKRIDVSMSFKVSINKPSLSQTKFIEGNVSSYGILTGSFNLNDFDTVIQNTQSDLIIRLSKNLKSKI